MSSGLGEWEKGIPCMPHGSQGSRPGGVIGLTSEVLGMSCYPLLASWPCEQRALFPKLWAGNEEPWPLFTALVSTLAHKGKSQALPSAPTGCETS